MDGVSAFIVGTCQFRPKMHIDVYDSMQFSIWSQEKVRLDYSLPCGSTAEFYIEPINSCIEDMDVLEFASNSLAFTDDIPVLPDDLLGLLDTITCLQIVSYPDYPGFVELRNLGEMSYDWHCKKFDFRKTNKSQYLFLDENRVHFPYLEYRPTGERQTVGPAVKCIFIRTDIVPCVRCPQWPIEAKEWPYRRRKYGWPTTAYIQKIVESGCHVVFAKHPACRNDVRQWRLSFSGAELYLIRSWTPVQQIIYHMLRFFAKRELIKKDCPKEDEVLCTYHFKTLMLWSCENMSPEWWNSSSVVELCCSLMRKASNWLKKGLYPNYFIPQANLHHEHMKKKQLNETIKRLNHFCHIRRLNVWFAVNYMKPILENVLTIEDTLEVEPDAGYCMLRICQIMDSGKLKNFDSQFSFTFWCCVIHTSCKDTLKLGYSFRKVLNTLHCWKSSAWEDVDRSSFLPTMEFLSNFPVFAKVLFILPVVYELQFGQTTYDNDIFTEFVREVSWQPKVLRSTNQNFPRPSKANLNRSEVVFLKVQNLMENITGLNKPQEFKLLSQLAKELLRKAIGPYHNDDLNSRAIRGVALVYMAALHFSESDYETALDLCSTVFTDQTPNDETEEQNTEALNAGCLFHIDDIVRIVGFDLLFRRIKDNSQHTRRQSLLGMRITPEVFAQYLIISSIDRRRKPFVVSGHTHFQDSRFPLDIILTTLMNRKVSDSSNKTGSVSRVYQRTDPINKFDARNKFALPHEVEITQLLMEYSLENMTVFYHAIRKDFGIECNTTECYRAAYLYNCRKYPEALHLCERILEEPDLQRILEELVFANVMVLPPLESYFDSDIRCLLGFRTLVCYLSPLKEDLRKAKCPPKSNCKKLFDAQDLLLSADLCSAFSIKCNYFIGRHFLARYLKVRYLIDCNHSFSEAMLEFKKLKSSLPFEHTIRCFVLQKLRRL